MFCYYSCCSVRMKARRNLESNGLDIAPGPAMCDQLKCYLKHQKIRKKSKLGIFIYLTVRWLSFNIEAISGTDFGVPRHKVTGNPLC